VTGREILSMSQVTGRRVLKFRSNRTSKAACRIPAGTSGSRIRLFDGTSRAGVTIASRRYTRCLDRPSSLNRILLPGVEPSGVEIGGAVDL